MRAALTISQWTLPSERSPRLQNIEFIHSTESQGPDYWRTIADARMMLVCKIC
jgi:hypothetical protein